MTTEISHVRKPWVAMSLSLTCCGLGQLYCGRAGRGLVMYSLSMLVGPLIAIAAILGGSTLAVVMLLVTLIAFLALTVWSAYDARNTACRMAAIDFEPQDYNRPVVYGLMALTWLPYALGLALYLRANVVEAFYLPTSSMAPTLVRGDCVLTNKLGIGTRDLERGEVVVFRNPQNRRQKFIKRIVALPGETVEIKAGQLLIDGKPLKREPAPLNESDQHAKADSGQTLYEWNGERRYTILVGKDADRMDTPQQTVQAGSYFVLGDNRGLSLDSRELGTISHGEIVGCVVYLYRPGDTWKRFGPVR